jgi:uncharacterized protein YcfJ
VVHSTGGYSHPKSASGMAVGGILGGVIGHQVGKGRGNKLATALGAIIGASIGHDAVNGHVQSSQGHRYTPSTKNSVKCSTKLVMMKW